MNYETRKVVVIFLIIMCIITFSLPTKKDKSNNKNVKVWATI